MICSIVPSVVSQTAELLDPTTIPKFVNQLDGPPTVFNPINITDDSGNLVRQEYTVKASEFKQQMLPSGFPQTTVWGYEGDAKDPLTGQDLGSVASTPGSTFEAIQGVPVQVKWVNNLVDSSGKPMSYFLPVDPTIHWANPNGLSMDATEENLASYPPGNPQAQTPVPIVTHLHGGEDPSTSDGHPDAWYTPDGEHGPAYTTEEPTDPNAAVYVYPNNQQPTTLWYHDHALGLTRLSVLSGLAGVYIIRNTSDPVEQFLPQVAYDVPLLIQDRSFYTDGSFYYPTVGNNPSIHPEWNSSFLGNTIIVNGEVWPNMNVKQGLYRFRIVDGSNSRFYQISFSNGMSFTQIGSDGGYLKAPVEETSQIIAPAERIDILVDFSNLAPGAKVVMQNFAGTAQGSEPTGEIMQFTVTDEKGVAPQQLPADLNPTLAGDFPNLPAPDNQRILTLIDMGNINGSYMMLLDGQKWSASISETPKAGTTEDWIIVNPTMDAHPIHLHLVQFQIVSRQTFDLFTYMDDWTNLNDDPPLNHSTINVQSLEPYLTGTARTAEPSEQGWKDTVIVYSGEVATIRVRWAEQDGNPYSFDASAGPGYVWHCHLLEHEDNEMMRPYTVASSGVLPSLNLQVIAVIVAVAVAVAVVAVLFVVRRLRRR